MSINQLYTTLTSTEIIDRTINPLLRVGTITTGNLVAGSVLGKVNTSVGTPTYGAENVGDGTIGTISLGAQAFGGIYRLECIDIDPSTLFKLTSPMGNVISEAIAVGSQQTTTHLVFTLTQGNNDDFAVGDLIFVPVLAGNYKLSASAAGDGSAVPSAILINDVDATSAPTEALILTFGAVFKNALIFGTGHSIGTTEDTLRQRGIHFSDLVLI